ncbi:hypothetical protein [Vibrio sp. Hep-1b-8]|uniref:hypothetical protein n=1 Tax=Vibrio sp. Hep-1b-8 TaxID=2144187 RepID=UPI0011106450|nr:hypothetical protein [Vibrio sp. Hep-1b-8]TMX38253.1 hypothetical protein DA100_10575 [Vibrio sp. Hep-1b-8]
MNEQLKYWLLIFVSQYATASVSPTVDNLSLDSQPVLGSETNIVYQTTPASDIIINYATCVTDEIEDCTLASSYLVAGTIYDDGNPPIPASIPNQLDVLGKYFTYCLEISDKNASPMECRSDIIISESVLKGDRSYITQSVDFNMYDQGEDQLKESKFVTTNSAFLTVDKTGNAFTYGSGSESLLPPLQYNVERIYSLLNGFGVLKTNKTLTLWGEHFSNLVSTTEVSRVFPSAYSVAVLKEDGHVEVYGNSNKGAFIPENTQAEINRLITLGGKVSDIYYTSQAYLATFLMPTGGHRVVTWGNPNYGGDLPDDLFNKLLNVRYVVSTSNSFAILTYEGDVYTWGVSAELKTYQNIKDLKATRYAFAAITNDGNVEAWGERGYGGQLSSSAGAFIRDKPISRLCATDSAFVAIADGFKGLAAWGDDEKGGYIPSSLQQQLDSTSFDTSTHCVSSEGAFALYNTEQLWVWGGASYGGVLPESIPKYGTIEITSNNRAFLLINHIGVFAWGDEKSGGCIPNGKECISEDDPNLNLEQDIFNLNFDEVKLGGFSNYSDSESQVRGGFYISDSNKALVWGSNFIDANVSW